MSIVRALINANLMQKGGKMKILYIEDNKNIREAGKMLLERKKHNVVAREDTKKALGLACIWEPDLIITDHDLGTDETGLMFAEKAKKRGFKVVMMTGSDVKEESEALGVPFFSKPCCITDILKTLAL